MEYKRLRYKNNILYTNNIIKGAELLCFKKSNIWELSKIKKRAPLIGGDSKQGAQEVKIFV